MDSEIARIAWQLEALAAQLDPPGQSISAPTPPRAAVEVQHPLPMPSTSVPASWFANVMQASAMGLDGVGASREFLYLADAMQRVLVGVVRRVGDLEQHVVTCSASDSSVEEDIQIEDDGELPSQSPFFDWETFSTGLAQQLDLLDARLEACTNSQLSGVVVGEQLQSIADRIERLERVSDENSPLLEALVESGARVELLDAKLDASLQRTEQVASIVERLDPERVLAGSLHIEESLSENLVGDGEPQYHSVLEDLPFDDQAAGSEPDRRSFFRRS